jgi:hypothetical protein
MDKIVGLLNNRYLIAIVVGLFVLGVFRRFAGR